MRDLEVFNTILAGIDTEVTLKSGASLFENNHSARQSLQLCKEAATDLDAVSQDLMRELHVPGRIYKSAAAMKVVMKRGHIDRQMPRLQDGMELPSLSRQCYTMSVFHRYDFISTH